jgi:hypothetical protein
MALFGSWILGGGSHQAEQRSGVVLDNEHVRVTRNAAPCAAGGPGCGDRVLVTLGGEARGSVRVFPRGERYTPPAGIDYLEVTIRPQRPPVKSPPVLIAPDKNSILYDGDDFFVFEEKLDAGDTRARHSHRERVVIVINRTRLQQWPDGAPELFRDQVPDDVRFNPPVVHVVKTVGDQPLRNIVIELKR